MDRLKKKACPPLLPEHDQKTLKNGQTTISTRTTHKQITDKSQADHRQITLYH